MNQPTSTRRKLTEEIVRQIKQALWEGHSQADVARHFAVSPVTVNHISQDFQWRHVPWPIGERPNQLQPIPSVEQTTLQLRPIPPAAAAARQKAILAEAARRHQVNMERHEQGLPMLTPAEHDLIVSRASLGLPAADSKEDNPTQGTVEKPPRSRASPRRG